MEIPPPAWSRYLESVSEITLKEENSDFREFMKNEDLREKLDQDIILKDTIQRIEEAFEKMVPEKDKKLLNAVKRKEIDSIRRRLIPVKKQHSNDAQLPTHLNFTVLPFIAQDIGLLIKANAEHVRRVISKTLCLAYNKNLFSGSFKT